MPRFLPIFGTRPEAIKMAPLIRALKPHRDAEIVVCVTGQHREMLDQILNWFQIVPDIDLDLMTPNQTLAGLTATALKEVTGVIEKVRPDVVLVQGDTTTAMASALAAFYLRVPVGHIEAGLRTNHLYNPFPEEINRHIISVMASYNFAPTEAAREALLREGTLPESIFLTGNTVIDALQWTVKQPYELKIDAPLNHADEQLIVITGHRRESFGPAFESICTALRDIATRNPQTRLIYPVHLNPNVQGPVYRILRGVDRVHLTNPLPYPAFAHLMAKSHFIISDSGGVQEEAPALGKPVLVMRETTERPEAIAAGTARLVGTDSATIIAEAERLLNDSSAYEAMAHAHSPFGDGHAAEKIAEILLTTAPPRGHEFISASALNKR